MERLTVIFIWMLHSSLGEVLEGCQSPQYLQFRKLGSIHCNLNDTFSAVFWYDSTNILNDEPIVTLTHSIKGGQGYTSGEFDITSDGSLLIFDVGLNHEKNFTVARFVSLDENPSTFTVSVVVTDATTDGCDSPQYLEYGSTGTVHCYFQKAFESVFWYNSTLVLSDPPIVTYIQSAKGGRAYELGEFDVFPNGSLLINEVKLAHENNFTVAKFTSLNEDPVYFIVRVIVTVKYHTGGPVIEQCNGANTTCYVELEGLTSVSCIVKGVRPAVSLKWLTLTGSGYRNISYDVDIISNNFTFTSVAVTSDAFAYSLVLNLLVCKAEFAPGVLQRDESLVLVHNNERNLSSVPHVIKYAARGSALELKCSATKILFLVWKRSLLFDNFYQKLIFAFLMKNRSATKYQNNFELGENGSLVLRQIDLKHDGFYGCIYGDGITDGMRKYKVVTYVKPDPPYPVVEGCNFQRNCVLEVQRKGNLTCTIAGLRPEVSLEWKESNETSLGKISFFDHTTTVTKSGETFNITLTSSYSITSVTRVTVECGVSGSASDVFPENSVVTLLLVPAPVKATDNSNVAVKIVPVSLIPIVAVLLICGILLRKARRNKKKRRRKSLTRLPLMAIPKISRNFTHNEIRVSKKRLVHQLKQTYRRRYNVVHTIPFIRDRLVGINNVMVEGYVEKLASSGKIEKHNERGQDHCPSTKGESVWQKLDSYSDMVKDTLRNSGRLILEGEPGYGKSTVTLQMAADWCNDVPYLEDVEIFILLRLRQLGGVQSIYQAIKHFILAFNSQITETDLQYILAHSESLMIVLDGYDEYPVNYRGRNNFLTEILIGDIFPNARVILTTSPSVLPNHCAPQTKRIRLAGFDDKARGEYIRKAVVGDDETAAENIKQCISKNSIVNDLCQTPFFFAIAVHMCQESKGFKNLKTVTGFFKLMMSCFHKANGMNLNQWESSAKNHDKLNKEAFESLNGKKQLSYWQKEKLLERLGQDLYDQYVGAGILVEEEICDISDTHRSLEYTHLRKVMAVRFYHHLLCEWYAAHYLAMMISKFTRAAKRTSGLGFAYSYNLITKITKHTESLLSKIKAFHLQYIYRFACGLNHNCTVPIAQYLQDNGYNKCFIILCIMEQEENVGNILDYVTNLCSTDIFIINTNTVLQQKSTIQLLKIASAKKVPISKVLLIDSFKNVNRSNESIQLQSEFELPALATLKEIEIVMKGEALTEEEFEKFLKYLSKCPQLEKLSFSRCCLPDPFQPESDLKFGNKKVVWSLSDKVMSLNYQTGKWEIVADDSLWSREVGETNVLSCPSTETTCSVSSDRGNKSRRNSFSKKEELYDLQSMPTAFRYLSSQLSTDWRSIGRSLGIQDSKLDQINTDNICSQERNYQMFIHWKQRSGSKASYVNLIKALEKAGRKDLAEDLQNLKSSRRVSLSTKSSHFLRLKMTDQTCQLRETTTGRQRRKFREESMELTFHYLSRKLGKEWLDVGRILLLSDAELYNISAECTSTQEAIYRMLNKWKMEKGYGATYDVLTNCLREVGREDLATEFREREEDMPMKPACKGALNRALEELTENLQVEAALTHLQNEGCMSEFVAHEIRQKTSETEKCRVFVGRLKTCGQAAYDVFRAYLSTAPGQEYLGETLDGYNADKDLWTWRYKLRFMNIECDHHSITDYQKLPEKLSVVLLGKTGSGKSATGNTILGKADFSTSTTAQSCTRKNVLKICNIGKTEIHVIDTPGLFDTGSELTNEETLLSVVNTVINFETGIHLFLLITNFTKYTNEEEETIKAIENALTDKIYQYCVIILTHSKNRFSEESQSLRHYIDEEKKLDGAFAQLLMKVKYNVIAVENSFEDCLLREKHREHFLSCLGQVIVSNSDIYSNQLFVSARQKFQKEIEERRKRYNEDEHIFEMRIQLQIFLLTSVVPNLTSHQMEDLGKHLKTNRKQILRQSNLPKLLNNNEQYDHVFENFPESHETIVSMYTSIKNEINSLHLAKQESDNSNNQESSKLKFKISVNQILDEFITTFSEEQLQKLLRKSHVPIELTERFRDKAKYVGISKSDVNHVVNDVMFGQCGLLQDKIDGKNRLTERIQIIGESISELERQAMQHTINLTILDEFFSLLKLLSDNNLKILFKWENENNKQDELPSEAIEELLQIFQQHKKGKQGTELDFRKCRSFFKKNANVFKLHITLLKEEHSAVETLKHELENFRNTNGARRKVGDIIDKHWKQYLTNTTLQELQDIDMAINNHQVPRDILTLVLQELYANKNIIDEDKIEEEILIQLCDKRDIFKSLINEAKACFPGSSLVLTKQGKPKHMSLLQVGDEILVCAFSGILSFEKVYLLSHANSQDEFVYIRICTEHNKELLISPCHLLPINSPSKNVPAFKASIDDMLFSVVNGAMIPDKITSVTFKKCIGAYCPMTTNGSIIVNDVATSCYTTFFNPNAAHALLFPVRSMFKILPKSTFDYLLPYDYKEGMPVLLAKCRSVIIFLRNMREKYRWLVNPFPFRR